MKKKNLIILFVGIMIFISSTCARKNEQQSANESMVTLLCFNDNEQSVFRDGKGTMFLMFLPLVYWDEEDKPQPGLLERWEHSEDYNEWTFYLRKDVKWHDGKPVTAQDVKFTLELITDPNIMYENRFFREITIVRRSGYS